MTREEKVQYWLDVVAEDLDLAEFLLKSGRWLKAYWTATRDDTPPYIHDHKRLAEFSGLYEQMSDEQRRFLHEIRPMNIEARYPDYKRAVAKSLNAEITSHFVEQTKQMQQWILQKCFLAMKPSGSSENTNA